MDVASPSTPQVEQTQLRGPVILGVAVASVVGPVIALSSFILPVAVASPELPGMGLAIIYYSVVGFFPLILVPAATGASASVLSSLAVWKAATGASGGRRIAACALVVVVGVALGAIVPPWGFFWAYSAAGSVGAGLVAYLFSRRVRRFNLN